MPVHEGDVALLPMPTGKASFAYRTRCNKDVDITVIVFSPSRSIPDDEHAGRRHNLALLQRKITHGFRCPMHRLTEIVWVWLRGNIAKTVSLPLERVGRLSKRIPAVSPIPLLMGLEFRTWSTPIAIFSPLFEFFGDFSIPSALENIGVSIQIAIPQLMMPSNVHETKLGDASIIPLFLIGRKGRASTRRQIITVI